VTNGLIFASRGSCRSHLLVQLYRSRATSQDPLQRQHQSFDSEACNPVYTIPPMKGASFSAHQAIKRAGSISAHPGGPAQSGAGRREEFRMSRQDRWASLPCSLRKSKKLPHLTSYLIVAGIAKVKMQASVPKSNVTRLAKPQPGALKPWVTSSKRSSPQVWVRLPKAVVVHAIS
jgi:hypothetical protein